MTIRVYHTEYRKLERLAKKENNKTQANRYRVVICHYRKLNKSAINRCLGVARSTINRILDRFERERMDGLIDCRYEQSPRKVTDEYIEHLFELIFDSPRAYGWHRGTWTRELLSLQLKKQTGIKCHPSHIGRLLHRENIVWNRAKSVAKQPADPAYKKRCINRLKRLKSSLNKDETLLYQDEVDIHLNPKIGPCWMPKGQQFEIETPGQNKKRYIFGGLNALTGSIIWTISERKNATGFIDWLEELSRRYRRYKKLHVILDNYAIHKTKQVKEALKRLKWITLHFLPPYSPEHNPIERLWGELHAHVTRNHQCTNIEELMGLVNQFLTRVAPYPGNKPAMVV